MRLTVNTLGCVIRKEKVEVEDEIGCKQRQLIGWGLREYHPKLVSPPFIKLLWL